jgi:hypothetical protein
MAMSDPLDLFSEREIDQLTSRGMDPDEVATQLRVFREPPPPIVLDRPCTVGDGVRRLSKGEEPELLAKAEAVIAAGRTAKFVPASGAATRMFGTLLPMAAQAPTLPELERRAPSDPAAADVVQFWRNVKRLPFLEDLEEAFVRRGDELSRALEHDDVGAVLHTLLDPTQMGYAELPKGLIKFHRYTDGARTPFEEHLREAAEHVRGTDGVCRIHFTVSPEHRRSFESLLADVRFALSAKLRTSFHVGWSVQSPTTDTLAVGLDNRPVRDADGTLQFRQGGHGSLIWNLEALDSEIVFVKNIDNLVPDRTRPVVVKWKKLLLGVLVDVQGRVFEAVRRLEAGDLSEIFFDQCFHLLAHDLSLPWTRASRGLEPEARVAFLLDRLKRPIRVCGVVRNQGEPGGGPFWVRDGEGRTSLQIVESSQVNTDAPDQVQIARAATHFNPVDLVCGLRGSSGVRFDLESFIDPNTVFVSRKLFRGREIKALERPGLWNGAMAGWNTVFVEVPVETFAPVKTVLDLLRPEHQA